MMDTNKKVQKQLQLDSAVVPQNKNRYRTSSLKFARGFDLFLFHFQ